MQLIQISRLPHRQVGANFTLEFQRTSGHYLWLDDLAISFSPFFPRRKNRSLQSLVGSAFFGYHVVSASNKRPHRAIGAESSFFSGSQPASACVSCQTRADTTGC